MREVGAALILLALGATFAWAQFSPSLKFAMPTPATGAISCSSNLTASTTATAANLTDSATAVAGVFTCK